ncbi:MAG: hypothetical protein AAGA20_18385 [Planctomycetota bacterium]
MNDDALDATREFVLALESLGVRYLVGGSLASTTWGEPRFTQDVDLACERAAMPNARVSPNSAAAPWA